MSEQRPVVLIVEDEKAYTDALTIGLPREGFDVITAATGTEGLELFKKIKPDIVLLDLMLPGMAGVDVCREIRSVSNTPVVMVTAKDSELDMVLGLELGADDYITKPYRLRELVARIRAVLRRSKKVHADLDDSEVVTAGEVEVDLRRHAVKIRGEELILPPKEFDLLEVLVSNAGRAVSRSTLMNEVWGTDFIGESKTIDVHIQRLRVRIESDPADPKIITTIRGHGYRFEKDLETVND